MRIQNKAITSKVETEYYRDETRIAEHGDDASVKPGLFASILSLHLCLLSTKNGKTPSNDMHSPFSNVPPVGVLMVPNIQQVLLQLSEQMF